jgi:hypothetical protein
VPVEALAHPRGEEGTSCLPPFPGHPGLSQSPCGGFFMPPWSRLFYQGTRQTMSGLLEMERKK